MQLWLEWLEKIKVTSVLSERKNTSFYACLYVESLKSPVSPKIKKKHNKNDKLLYSQQTNPRYILFSRPGRVFCKKGLLSEQCVCDFKEGINMASYTFARFLAPKPDLWTACEEPPGTMSSLHNIWLVFQWSKPARHYESNADRNMFSTVNRQAFGGEEGLLLGRVTRIWVALRGNTMINCWSDSF